MCLVLAMPMAHAVWHDLRMHGHHQSPGWDFGQLRLAMCAELSAFIMPGLTALGRQAVECAHPMIAEHTTPQVLMQRCRAHLLGVRPSMVGTLLDTQQAHF